MGSAHPVGVRFAGVRCFQIAGCSVRPQSARDSRRIRTERRRDWSTCFTIVRGTRKESTTGGRPDRSTPSSNAAGAAHARGVASTRLQGAVSEVVASPRHVSDQRHRSMARGARGRAQREDVTDERGSQREKTVIRAGLYGREPAVGARGRLHGDYMDDEGPAENPAPQGAPKSIVTCWLKRRRGSGSTWQRFEITGREKALGERPLNTARY